MALEDYHLAIAVLVISAILICPALYVLYAHGRRSCVAWIFLIITLTLQIVGQALIVKAGPHAISKTGLIISQIGLSALLFTADGIIREIVTGSSIASTFLFGTIASVVFHLVVGAAAALIGVGASSLYNPSSEDATSARGETRAAAIILLLSWIFLVVRTALISIRQQEYKAFRYLFGSLIFGLFWLLIRIVYTILAYFATSSSPFNPLNGNLSAKVAMQVLPVILTAIVFIIGGLFSHGAARNTKVSSSADNIRSGEDSPSVGAAEGNGYYQKSSVI